MSLSPSRSSARPKNVASFNAKPSCCGRWRRTAVTAFSQSAMCIRWSFTDQPSGPGETSCAAVNEATAYSSAAQLICTRSITCATVRGSSELAAKDRGGRNGSIQKRRCENAEGDHARHARGQREPLAEARRVDPFGLDRVAHPHRVDYPSVVVQRHRRHDQCPDDEQLQTHAVDPNRGQKEIQLGEKAHKGWDPR